MAAVTTALQVLGEDEMEQMELIADTDDAPR